MEGVSSITYKFKFNGKNEWTDGLRDDMDIKADFIMEA